MLRAMRFGESVAAAGRAAWFVLLAGACSGPPDNPFSQAGGATSADAGAGGHATSSGGGASSSGSSSAGGGPSKGGSSSAGDDGNGGGGDDGNGGASAGAGTVAGGASSACAALSVTEQVSVADVDCDRVTWRDAQCRPRTAAMVRVGGGYVRQVSYALKSGTRTITGTDAAGHKGWGFTMSHFDATWTSGQDAPGKFRVLFAGAHHAIYEYQSAPVIKGQPVPVTQHWFFATGRDHPVLATTYDLSGIAPGSLLADLRTPYGDLAWDGDENAQKTVVSGVAWGDRYRFTTTSTPLTMNSDWDYSKPNTVPFVSEWALASDAEMGAVQTQTQLQHDAGGYWFYTGWGKTSADGVTTMGQIGKMTPTWNWTYQLNQYELCQDDPACLEHTTGSHRLAWGANYGALGGKDASGMYDAYGGDKLVSGYPYQSYSVFLVLGPHSAAPTLAQVAEIEAVQRSKLTASVGKVPTSLAGGVGRTDPVKLEPPGWDARYAIWSVASDETGELKLEIDTPGLTHPVFAISGRHVAPSQIKLDGALLVADRDYLLSFDPAGDRLWLTLLPGLSGKQRLELK